MTVCKFTSTTTPRVLPQRHEDGCRDDTCAGCAPCPLPHCRVDGRTHVERAQQACAECVGEFRANLHEIAGRIGELPDEVRHRGINGEAMVLLAPSANFEARGHLEASVLAGRLNADAIGERIHLKDCRDGKCLGCEGQLHPDFVLGQMEDVWRDALDHDPPVGLFNLAKTVAYLDQTLTYMASWPHLPFEEDAARLRRCASHLEAVLHDQERGVRANVPCFECGAELERRLGKEGFEDHWTCRGCKRRYTIAEYNFALRAELEGQSA